MTAPPPQPPPDPLPPPDPSPLPPLPALVPDAAAMRAAGAGLAAYLRAGDLVVLSGDLGAGKTTFVQGLGAGLGVRGPVTSPTFVLARVHPPLPGGRGLPLVHVDAYRLGSAVEVDDLDLDADLDAAVTVVEWGAGLVEDLAADRLDVAIGRALGPGRDGGEDEARTLALRAVGPRWVGGRGALRA